LSLLSLAQVQCEGLGNGRLGSARCPYLKKKLHDQEKLNTIFSVSLSIHLALNKYQANQTK